MAIQINMDSQYKKKKNFKKMHKFCWIQRKSERVWGIEKEWKKLKRMKIIINEELH